MHIASDPALERAGRHMASTVAPDFRQLEIETVAGPDSACTVTVRPSGQVDKTDGRSGFPRQEAAVKMRRNDRAGQAERRRGVTERTHRLQEPTVTADGR